MVATHGHAFIYRQRIGLIKIFLPLARHCDGYSKDRVTPYMHVLAYHIPYFIKKYGSIKQFSCQGMISDMIMIIATHAYIRILKE